MRRLLFVVGLPLLAAACSTQVLSSSGGSVGAGGSGAGSVGSGGTGGTGGDSWMQFPAAPPPTPPDGTGVTTFAIIHLFLGSTARDDMPEMDAWEQYGFDIDGKDTGGTNGWSESCQRVDNAPQEVQRDGPRGLDNSFGHNIVPVLLGVSPEYETQVNEAIAAGSTSTLFSLVALGSDATYNPVAARAYTGAATASQPVWDGNDMWPVTAESLDDPADITSAQVVTAGSYLTGNTWVALFKGVLVVELPVSNFPLHLRIHDPDVIMQLSPNHQGATGGILEGVLSTEEFIEDIKKFTASFDSTLCSSPVIESITAQMAQASDIMADRTQDPTKTCDSISIGLGFSAARVTLGSVAPPTPPPPNPCAMP